MTLDNYTGGIEKTYRGGRFYFVEKSLGDIDTGKIGDFIREHKNNLLLKDIRRKFPEMAHIPKQRMLFLDIETCGLDVASQIISISLLHMHHGANLSLECLFARNPAEEKPVLEYFLDKLHFYKAFFTYNGKSFDIPRIRARTIHNGLYEPNLEGLLSQNDTEHKDESADNIHEKSLHHDLYHICKSRIHLADAKLTTIEKTLPVFGHFRRQDDIPSEDIPKAYYEYVYGRKRNVTQVIADKELWRKCLAKAEKNSNFIANPELSDKEKENQVRSFAKGLYEGIYADLPSEFEELREAHGGYREEYSPGKKIKEEERKIDMAKLIHHNLLDTVTLAGILCYLCSPEGNQKSNLTHSEGELPF
jgi:uncharacterized protein YprB with RNaseH-like and TPR domain